MQRTRNRNVGALVIAAAVIAAAGLATPAQAGQGNGPRGPGIRHVKAHKGGWLQIGKRTFVISARRPLRSVLNAFECAGYHAWSDGRSAFVRVGWRTPALAWTSDLYAAEFVIADGCLTITLDFADCGCAGAVEVYDRRAPIRVGRRERGLEITSWPRFDWRSGVSACEAPRPRPRGRTPYGRIAVRLGRD